MKKLFTTVLILAIIILFSAVGIWYWGLPDSYVAAQIENLNVAPFTLQIEGLKKNLLFSFGVEKISLSNDGEEVWSIHSFAGNIGLLNLVKGRAVINVRGISYGGAVSGIISAEKENHNVDMRFSDIDVSAIPYLKSFGLQSSGMLSGSLSSSNDEGNAEFVLDNAVLKGFTRQNVYIPLEYFHTVRGAIDFMPPGSVTIKSITLEGKGIYVRLKGEVVNRVADVEIEIMPESSFPDRSLLMFVERYKISDGYYYIPVKRRL